MSAFDPHAATEALLNALPAAARLKAVSYTQGGHWVLLGSTLVSLLACVLIARSGVIRGLVARLQTQRPRPVLVSFLAAVTFGLVDFVVELPWDIWAHWKREMDFGLTSQPLTGWLGEHALMAVISAPLSGLLLMGLYTLMRRAPRLWPYLGGGMVAGFMALMLIFAVPLIEPLFNTFTPAPPGPARDAVVELAKVAGVPSDRIFVYDGSKQSNRYTANVSGLFGAARVAMSDVMTRKGADVAEVRGVVGHEMGHYVRAHVVWGTLFNGLLALVGFVLVAALFPWAESWVKSGAKGVADPTGLPALSAVLTILSLLAAPLNNTASRLTEADADSFSLRVAHEPTGLAKALVKTIEYRADSPSALEEILFYDHPSVRSRVQKAMDWKAANLDVALDQEAKDAAAGR